MPRLALFSYLFASSFTTVVSATPAVDSARSHNPLTPGSSSSPFTTIMAFVLHPLPARNRRSAGWAPARHPRCQQRLPSVGEGNALPDVSVERGSEVKDGPLANFAISLFRRAMAPEIGWSSPRTGYDGFVEECRMLLARKPAGEQQRVVFKTLDNLFQAPVGTTAFRKYFSQRPGLNAAITPLFFKWLVGPCWNNRPDEGGHGVFIEKCRFLEESGCKGLCVNMCQQPTQRYFTEVLGLPVRMTPNYEDMSCQMTFGVAPRPMHEDPAVTGDCLAGCKMVSAVRRRGAAECYATKSAEK